MTGDMGQLLVRPRPAPGEATISYLSRVAEANGFASLGCLKGSLTHQRRTPFDQATKLLCLSSAERALLVGPLPRAWGGDPSPYGLNVGHFNLRWIRWCPLCLKGVGLVPWYWTLKSTVACLIHKTWLRDACAACGEGRRWGEAGFGRCACGARLSAQETENASAEVVELCAVAAGQAAHVPELSVLTAKDWQRAIVFFGQGSGGMQVDRPGKVSGMDRLGKAMPLLAAASAVTRDWPHGFHDLLDANLRERTGTVSLKQAFSPLYRILYRELASAPFSPFRNAFEAFIHEHWWGLVCKRNRRLKQSTIDVHPRVPVRKAAAMARVAPSVLRHMLQSELIFADAVTFPSGRKTVSVAFEEVDRVAMLAAGALSLQAAATALALPERRVRDLIELKEIAPLVSRQSIQSAAAWSIPASEIARFTVESYVSQDAASITVRDFMRYGRLAPAEVVDLLQAVMGGLMQVIGDKRRRVPIGKVLVDRTAAWEWLRKQRSNYRGYMSVDQAAKALGIKQEVGYALSKAGLLGGSNDASGKRCIAAADVERFRAEYVSLRDLARQIGVSPKSMLRSIPVSPVAGPEIDGSRQYFYRRLDVIRLGVVKV